MLSAVLYNQNRETTIRSLPQGVHRLEHGFPIFSALMAPFGNQMKVPSIREEYLLST